MSTLPVIGSGVESVADRLKLTLVGPDGGGQGFLGTLHVAVRYSLPANQLRARLAGCRIDV
jgi:hypothetical protein